MAGRLDYAGTEISPLNEAEGRDRAEFFKKRRGSGGSHMLHEFVCKQGTGGACRRVVRELLPGAYLSVSTDILPAIRFYDRVSTKVLNAYVGPILKGILIVW